MTITLNHTIVWARDKDAAARFFAVIFGLRVEGSGGHFAPVRVNDTLTLDFADAKGTIAGQHYAFHVSDPEFDAFIFTAAEYNRGPTAVLKNALDYAYAEWSNKPVAFVGYGGVGGARAVEQLRLHAIELQMAPIRSAIHILFPDYLAVIKDGKPLSELEHLNQAARQMLDQLAWWTAALKAAREKSLRQAA